MFRERVRPRLDEFVSRPAFEDAVRAHAAASIGTDAEFPITGTVGAWWGPVPDERQPDTKRTREGELDLVAHDGRRLVLAGEAKWSAGLEDGAALAQLRGTIAHVAGYDPAMTKLAIYTREGFTDGFRARATAAGVILRTVDDLYR